MTKLLTGRCSVWMGAGCALAAFTLAAPSAAADAAAPPAATPAVQPAIDSAASPAPAPAVQPEADRASPHPAAASAAQPDGRAQTPAPAAQPTILIPVPQLEQPVPRSVRIHDGFYLRLSAGIGLVGATFANGSDDAGDVSLDGSDLAMDLLVGGSPSPGVTLGGGLFTNLLLAADAEQDGQDLTDRDVGVLLVGPFIDGYPNPKKGWHLGGSLGLAVANMEDLGPRGDLSRTAGFGAAAWGGCDAWIGDDWSVGGLLRLGITRTNDRDDDAKITATSRSMTLMFTALYQ